jgi:hypothetical protein
MKTMLAMATAVLLAGAWSLSGCYTPDPTPKEGWITTNAPMPYPPSLTNHPPKDTAP